jgi:hypothetical protein
LVRVGPDSAGEAHVRGLRALVALADLELDRLALLEVAEPEPSIALKCTNTSGPSCCEMKP